MMDKKAQLKALEMVWTSLSLIIETTEEEKDPAKKVMVKLLKTNAELLYMVYEAVEAEQVTSKRLNEKLWRGSNVTND